MRGVFKQQILFEIVESMGCYGRRTIDWPGYAAPYLHDAFRIETHYGPLGRFRRIFEDVVMERILLSGIRNEHQRVREAEIHRFVIKSSRAEPQSRVCPSVAHSRLP